jgi:hypothetical protein
MTVVISNGVWDQEPGGNRIPSVRSEVGEYSGEDEAGKSGAS